MEEARELSPAKRKRLTNTYGSAPAGYTQQDLERILDVLYGLFSHIYTLAELRQMTVCNPFDRSEHPKHLTVVELTEWLEALLV